MPPRTPGLDPILVIDDEADLRELLDISIRRMGHDVVLAGSLAEAREKLAQRRYSLVLTDMRLGDGLGIEIVRQLSAAPERVPVAVITAYGSADNAVEALKAGAFDYIAKPVSLDQLRSLVLNALGRTSAKARTLQPALKPPLPPTARPRCCRGTRRPCRRSATRCRGSRAAWRPW